MLSTQPNDRGRCGVFLACAFVLTLMLASVPAQAMSTTHFFWDSISGDDLEFDLPTMPMPDFTDPYSFAIYYVPVSVNGGGPYTAHSIDFFTDALDGGFDVLDLYPYALQRFGPQLFSGPNTAPTFVDGDYELADSPGGDAVGTLHITSAEAIPEPSTIVLMGLGLVGLGYAGRRKLAP